MGLEAIGMKKAALWSPGPNQEVIGVERKETGWIVSINNEKVRLYARVGAASIAARDRKQDGYDAIITLMPWERFLKLSPRPMRWRGRRRSIPIRTLANILAASDVGRPPSSRHSRSRVYQPPPR